MTFIPMPKLLKNTAATQRIWYFIDAKHQILEPLAEEIGNILKGKMKPIASPTTDYGDFVVVKNASAIVMLNEQWSTSFYYTDTRVGKRNERFRDAKEMHLSDNSRVLWLEVKSKLTKDFFKYQRLERLYLFEYDDHPFMTETMVNLPQKYLYAPRLSDCTPEMMRNYAKIPFDKNRGSFACQSDYGNSGAQPRTYFDQKGRFQGKKKHFY